MIDFGIIAAGDGKRIMQEGSPFPKPLVEIEGKPMIGRLIELMEEAGARSVSIVVNEDMTRVIEYLQEFLPSAKCELKFESIKTPSSFHSFYRLIQLMKPTGKFIVATVDSVCRAEDFKNYVDYFLNVPHGIDGVMGVTTNIDDEKPLYVETEGRHRIVAFRDETFDGVKYVSAGYYGLQTSVFPILQECVTQNVSRMRNFQRKLLEQGLNLDAFPMGKVVDVDHLDDIAKANSILG